MKLRSIFAGVVSLSVACGLAAAQTAQPDSPPPNTRPDQPPPTAAEVFHRNGSSLFRASLQAQEDQGKAELSQTSFFSVPEPEPRVLKKHDLVTIIVREESKFESDGSAESKKEASLDASIDEFIQLNTLLREGQLKGGGVSDPVPSISMSAEREFKGEGNVDRTDKLTMRVTAEVVDVKPNGTVVLQARQRIVTDDEEQEFVLSGTCRAEDVSPDNTVLSTQMYDKELRKSHKGTVRNATRRGWLSKLLDVVSPF